MLNSVSVIMSATSSTTRIRKEIRSLSSTEWNKVVKALWIMKVTDDDEGKKMYGDQYISYDRLVLKHAIAALDDRGDQAHFGPIFSSFHSAFLRQAENSLLAIDPTIIGLPYWDITVGASASKNTIFSKNYFGSFVGKGKNYIVTDGVFANWPIAEYDKLIAVPANTIRVANPYGLLRHPLNVNKAIFMTRRGGTFCGELMTFDLQALKDYWNICLSVGEDIKKYMECVDPHLHGPSHLTVAGTWRRPSQKVDSNKCAQWFSAMHSSVKARCDGSDDCDISTAIIQGYAADCFHCHHCDMSNAVDNCMCQMNDHCNSHYESLNSFSVSDYMTQDDDIQILGDFADNVAAVNDPIFLFLHCDMDRHFQHWYQNSTSQSLRLSNYLNFPSNGYDGTNLDDIVNSKDPFIDIFDSSKLSRSKRDKLIARNNMLTHRDILDLTISSKIDYTYDSIIKLKQSKGKRSSVRGLVDTANIPEAPNFTINFGKQHYVRGFRSLKSVSNYEFRLVGTVIYVLVIMVILLLCIPYIIYFFCIKYCYPYTDTIETFEYTSNSCDNDDDVNEAKQDERKQDEAKQDEAKQDETK